MLLLAADNKRKVKLSKKWQRLYVESWGSGLKKAPFTVKLVGQRAGGSLPSRSRPRAHNAAARHPKLGLH